MIAYGQNTRTAESRPTQRSYNLPAKKEKKKTSFLKVKKKTETEAFRERLQKVYKQRAKEEKLFQKPQYSDPTYLGHKRPPKKRPVGKKKLCKECGIRH